MNSHGISVDADEEVMALMLISAELRWFWDSTCPDTVRDWFYRAPLGVGGKTAVPPRVDRYFHQPGNPEVGLKARDSQNPAKQKTEFKGLVGAFPLTGSDLPAASAQIWCKWSITPCEFGRLIDIQKNRRLRKFEIAKGVVSELTVDENEIVSNGAMPDVGCNLELTKVTAVGSSLLSWTLGFEAFGDLYSAPAALNQVLASLQPLPHFDGAPWSYPEWLDTLP